MAHHYRETEHTNLSIPLSQILYTPIAEAMGENGVGYEKE